MLLKALKSRTIQVALLQLALAVVVFLQGELPEAGALLTLKSFIDIALRAVTKEPLENK